MIKKIILILLLLAPFALFFFGGMWFQKWVSNPKIEIHKEKNKDVVLFLESIKKDILDIGTLEIQKSIELEESSQLITNGSLAKRFNLENLKIAGTDKKFKVLMTANGKLGFSDFTVEKNISGRDTSVFVTFPKPRILSMEIKHLDFETENALWLNDVSDAERAQLIEKAQEVLRKKILQEAKSHEQAKENVKSFIKKIFELSNDSVVVSFDEFKAEINSNVNSEERIER